MHSHSIVLVSTLAVIITRIESRISISPKALVLPKGQSGPRIQVDVEDMFAEERAYQVAGRCGRVARSFPPRL